MRDTGPSLTYRSCPVDRHHSRSSPRGVALNRSRKAAEAAEQAQQRRRQEDAAPRLALEVPRLESLSIAMAEGGPAGSNAIEHTRRVVVGVAPALFEPRCAHCKNGRHDITREIMRPLRDGATSIEGECSCDGTNGSANCPCVLRFRVIATYRK